MTQEALSFACLAGPGLMTKQARILAASIRRFGGEFSQAPIWGLLEAQATGLNASERSKFKGLGVRILRYRLPRDMATFPLARKVAAASAVENHAQGKTKHLVWMDAHSLVVQEPHETLLEDPFRFGCRPVDHLLIGSRFDEPVDPFWAYIYRICDVPEVRIFSMLTSVDQIEIRPYINAGFLVIKPEAGVLRRWFEVFAANFNSPRAHAFYEQDALWRVFMHQAVLSGVVLQRFKTQKIKLLPRNVNVPLHLFEDLDEDDSGEWLEQMVTIRYDVRFEEANWLDRLPLKSGMKAWLRQQWGTEVST